MINQSLAAEGFELGRRIFTIYTLRLVNAAAGLCQRDCVQFAENQEVGTVMHEQVLAFFHKLFQIIFTLLKCLLFV